MSIFGLIGIVLLPHATAAQQISPSDSLFSISSVYTSTAPIIDGVVSDSVWAYAAVATSFLQYEPAQGQPSVNETRAYTLYDDTYIYVAFVLTDSLPPTAQLIRRDSDLLEDDSVILLLDTFDDNQSAYYFMANALNTQTDGRIANDGRTIDDTWDTTWQTVASRTTGGWAVEIAIPFTSIKYSAGEDQSWGINFGRSHRGTLETSFWAGPLDQIARVSQAGSLTGMNIAPPAKKSRLIPYALTRIEQGEKVDWDAGVDLSYAITTKIEALATINPDFATIEADQERINLTRFELSLPEKRPFFIEGAELFRQRIRTYYSRRILDITAGGRVLGKTGPWTLAFLGTYNRPGDGFEEAVYTVGRVQRDLGTSNVAVIVANRSLDSLQQGSVEVDATVFFTSTIGLTTQLVQSWGQHNTGTRGFFVRPSLDTPIWHFHVRYTNLGTHLREHVNAIGFIRDDDRQELDSALEHIFWIRNQTFEHVTYGSNYNIYWSQEGILRSWQIDQSLEVELRNRFSGEISFSEEFKRFEKDFRNRSTTLAVGYNTRAFQSARVGYRFGRNFDADFQLVTALGALKVTEQLSVEYELQRLYLNPDPENESTWIHVVRVNQFFTPDLFLKVFYQTNSSIDRQNVQAAFVYRYQPPFGTVQVAYQRGTAAFGEQSDQGNTLFLKVTSVF